MAAQINVRVSDQKEFQALLQAVATWRTARRGSDLTAELVAAVDLERAIDALIAQRWKP